MAGRVPVVLGGSALHALEEHLAEKPASHAFILGDPNTLRHCLPELLQKVPALRMAEPIEVPEGESSKSLDVAAHIWQHLIDRQAGRDAILVCLGGGVVTDLGGFVAGNFKRGMRLVHVPTSLMGMVDAAIGGKAAIDLAGVKNVVGVFHDAELVAVHVPFLRNLGKRELLNGLAEMLKHALVKDALQWDALVKAPLHDLDALTPLILASVRIKAGIVSEDPRESGQRKLLNFGHTIGHAIEAFSWEGAGRALLHGEAVVAGMVAESWLSWRLGLLGREAYDRIAGHLLDLFPPAFWGPADVHRLVELMRNDKKNREGGFRFTLLERIGEGVVDAEVNAAQVIEALDHYRERVGHEGALAH
ncbi:MAG: 3-dehydroquinate synthase [Flavobacteriales bacterium]|nr:3-dehydroquinate synthase [Flavobacteriales bacterium]